MSEITTMPNDSKAFQVIVNLDVFEMYDALVSKKENEDKTQNVIQKIVFRAEKSKHECVR